MEGVFEYFASSVGIIFRSPSQTFSDLHFKIVAVMTVTGTIE
jgi:hypothetical protein